MAERGPQQPWLATYRASVAPTQARRTSRTSLPARSRQGDAAHGAALGRRVEPPTAREGSVLAAVSPPLGSRLPVHRRPPPPPARSPARPGSVLSALQPLAASAGSRRSLPARLPPPPPLLQPLRYCQMCMLEHTTDACTQLPSCSHWFCSDCCEGWISAGIAAGQLTFACPWDSSADVPADARSPELPLSAVHLRIPPPPPLPSTHTDRSPSLLRITLASGAGSVTPESPAVQLAARSGPDGLDNVHSDSRDAEDTHDWHVGHRAAATSPTAQSAAVDDVSPAGAEDTDGDDFPSAFSMEVNVFPSVPLSIASGGGTLSDSARRYARWSGIALPEAATAAAAAARTSFVSFAAVTVDSRTHDTVYAGVRPVALSSPASPLASLPSPGRGASQTWASDATAAELSAPTAMAHLGAATTTAAASRASLHRSHFAAVQINRSPIQPSAAGVVFGSSCSAPVPPDDGMSSPDTSSSAVDVAASSVPGVAAHLSYHEPTEADGLAGSGGHLAIDVATPPESRDGTGSCCSGGAATANASEVATATLHATEAGHQLSAAAVPNLAPDVQRALAARSSSLLPAALRLAATSGLPPPPPPPPPPVPQAHASFAVSSLPPQSTAWAPGPSLAVAVAANTMRAGSVASASESSRAATGSSASGPGVGRDSGSTVCGRRLRPGEVTHILRRRLPVQAERFERLVTQSRDPNARECPFPGCGHRQFGSAARPDMQCGKCGRRYCFWHASAHAGGSCSAYTLRRCCSMSALRSSLATWRARRCPGW